MTIGPASSILGYLASSTDHGRILLSLLIVIVAAKILAEVFERLRQPAVVGEILAGVIIGPSVLGLIQPSDLLGTLAEIGVIFLLFTVGLETRPSDIFKVGGVSALVAILGVIVPFLAGWALLSVWPGGHSQVEAFFLGAAMVATSVGITARVLSGMGLIANQASRVILAAAVIDDVIGLLVLAVVSSVASGAVDYLSIGITAVLAIGFTLLTVLFGARAVNRMKGPVNSLRIGHSLLIFALILCFGLAALASVIGIAGIVGAFLAGVAFSEATDGTELHVQSQTLAEFTAPFFLVNIGLQLNLAIFLQPDIVVLALVVTLLAIVTKLIGCGLGAIKMGKARALQIGIGMIPRGEVGIVVAQIGLGLAAVSDSIYGVVLVMAICTTLITPPFIKLAFAKEQKQFDPEAESELLLRLR
jgi:Kef-type K+ transport system membrane component KefB